MTFQRAKRERDERDRRGVNTTNQRDALLTLKPKLTQQVSSLPEETLHVGKAARNTCVCVRACIRMCVCVWRELSSAPSWRRLCSVSWKTWRDIKWGSYHALPVCTSCSLCTLWPWINMNYHRARDANICEYIIKMRGHQIHRRLWKNVPLILKK